MNEYWVWIFFALFFLGSLFIIIFILKTAYHLQKLKKRKKFKELARKLNWEDPHFSNSKEPSIENVSMLGIYKDVQIILKYIFNKPIFYNKVNHGFYETQIIYESIIDVKFKNSIEERLQKHLNEEKFEGKIEWNPHLTWRIFEDFYSKKKFDTLTKCLDVFTQMINQKNTEDVRKNNTSELLNKLYHEMPDVMNSIYPIIEQNMKLNYHTDENINLTCKIASLSVANDVYGLKNLKLNAAVFYDLLRICKSHLNPSEEIDELIKKVIYDPFLNDDGRYILSSKMVEDWWKQLPYKNP
jgi:hypothetical protein